MRQTSSGHLMLHLNLVWIITLLRQQSWYHRPVCTLRCCRLIRQQTFWWLSPTTSMTPWIHLPVVAARDALMCWESWLLRGTTRCMLIRNMRKPQLCEDPLDSTDRSIAKVSISNQSVRFVRTDGWLCGVSVILSVPSDDGAGSMTFGDWMGVYFRDPLYKIVFLPPAVYCTKVRQWSHHWCSGTCSVSTDLETSLNEMELHPKWYYLSCSCFQQWWWPFTIQ